MKNLCLLKYSTICFVVCLDKFQGFILSATDKTKTYCEKVNIAGSVKSLIIEIVKDRNHIGMPEVEYIHIYQNQRKKK